MQGLETRKADAADWQLTEGLNRHQALAIAEFKISTMTTDRATEIHILSLAIFGLTSQGTLAEGHRPILGTTF